MSPRRKVSRDGGCSITAGDGNKYLNLRDHVGNGENENFRLRTTPRHTESQSRGILRRNPFSTFLDVHFSLDPLIRIRGIIQHRQDERTGRPMGFLDNRETDLSRSQDSLSLYISRM